MKHEEAIRKGVYYYIDQDVYLINAQNKRDKGQKLTAAEAKYLEKLNDREFVFGRNNHMRAIEAEREAKRPPWYVNQNRAISIAQVKEDTEKDSPYFFERKTMKMFGQTMRSFKVLKRGKKYYIYADSFMVDRGKKTPMPPTIREYVPGRRLGEGKLLTTKVDPYKK